MVALTMDDPRMTADWSDGNQSLFLEFFTILADASGII